MNLDYELIDENNINLATSIQHTIFQDECAYVHYKQAIETNYKENIFYIIRYNGFPVGVIGLYMHDDLGKDSIWLGWFGVLPEFRGKGIGRRSLLDMMEKAKEYNKKYFRLYTNDKGSSNARALYMNIMHMVEKYNNSNDYNYNGNCLVYSYSLNGDKIKPWNNKFLFLDESKEEEEQGNKLWKSKYRILILSNHENEEFIEDEYIANAFREDGHIVKMAWVDYDENLDDKFDIIIRRNTLGEDKKSAEQSANISNLKVGFQKVDFLKLENNESILLEIEDNSPYMNLEKLDKTLRENVLSQYKKNIYSFLKTSKRYY